MAMEHDPSAPPGGDPAGGGPRDPRLRALGERVRLLRARRGLTRRSVAAASGVSERHLANLESGTGNASFLVCSSDLWLMLRELLGGRGEADLRRGRQALEALFRPAGGGARPGRDRRLALIGLRGAGKTTLGRMLAESLEIPFVELSREVERIAGASVREIHDLYGTAAYRRYERRALDETVRDHPEAVVATPGGIVAEPATFRALLDGCTTVWLQASPEEHMGRVAAQGDTRPMAASREAMGDLRRILEGRAAFYAKADATLDTGGRSEVESLLALQALAADLVPALGAGSKVQEPVDAID
jgi:XRE family aerobic/anaerobic benzoate catabolism transcriptional regulator